MKLLNEFEIAILTNIGKNEPWLQSYLNKLRVEERKFTGNGSYTDFEKISVSLEISDGGYSLKELISMPLIKNGMGATLFVADGHISFLEIYVFGGDAWNGIFTDFSIE